MHIEHIDPSGGDDSDNLCLACSSCNLSKSVATTALDFLTGTEVALFNPRIQYWQDHFEWIDNGLRILGKTPIGRAINQPNMIVDEVIINVIGNRSRLSSLASRFKAREYPKSPSRTILRIHLKYWT